jgi:exonuclease SbcC
MDTEIDNLESLGIARKSLDDLVNAIETNSELSKTAISVLAEMLQEEERRVERLFGEESSVSTTFKAITKGRYKAVVYDSASRTLRVLLEDGTSLNPEDLSKGTRDQLYFTVRVSLGTTLLKGKPGFFIMDDAFTSSDEERLQQQLTLVKQLADAGWQTIYFTPHRNTADAFGRITKTQPIVLKPL